MPYSPTPFQCSEGYTWYDQIALLDELDDLIVSNDPAKYIVSAEADRVARVLRSEKIPHPLE